MSFRLFSGCGQSDAIHPTGTTAAVPYPIKGKNSLSLPVSKLHTQQIPNLTFGNPLNRSQASLPYDLQQKQPSLFLSRQRRKLLLKTKMPNGCRPTIWHLAFVGATGFEPATTWSQTRSATGLRYTPLFRIASAKVTSFSDPCKFSYMFFLKFSFAILRLESRKDDGEPSPLHLPHPIAARRQKPCGNRPHRPQP